MNKPFKLLFTDIDGTLLDSERYISTQTKDAFDQMGVDAILISSRQPSAMYYLQEALDISGTPLVCYNGGLIIKQGKVLSSITISEQITKAALVKAKSLDLHLSTYHLDTWTVPMEDQWTAREINNTRVPPKLSNFDQMIAQENHQSHKMMGMGEPEKVDALILYLETTFPNQLHCYRSKDTYVEISPMDISKKTAIEEVLSHYYPGIQLQDCIAFGDNYNDIEMLQAVGIGVAMGNAKDAVKQIAKHHTIGNKEHGVAHFLNSF